MSKICELSGKRPTVANSIVRRGKAKRDGGVGEKTTGITRRWQYPNVQKVNVTVAGQVVTFTVAASYMSKLYEIVERSKGMNLEGLNAKQIKARLLSLV